MNTEKRKPLVLLVARDSETRVSLYTTLEEKGWLVATRPPDVEALRYAATQKPNVAFLGLDPQDPALPFLKLRLKSVSPKTRILMIDGSRSGSRRQVLSTPSRIWS